MDDLLLSMPTKKSHGKIRSLIKGFAQKWS